jgi:glycosyltransferase involved in cell wall biosynthesis
MNIAIDMSPLRSGHYLQHRVRGTGFYLQNLKISLEKYYPENKYIYFNRGDKLEENIDVIHYPYFEPFFLTLPVSAKYKKVATVHDLTPLVFPDHFKSGLRGSIKWQIQKLALKSCEKIITDSESSKKDIVKHVRIDPARVSVVYLAAGSEFKIINSDTAIEKIMKKYELPKEFALYVGDVTWNKNLPRLMEAAVMAKVPLVMVGNALVNKDIDKKNSWNKDLVKVWQLAGKNKNIFSLGFVSSEDLVTLYNAATIFVMPSIYEGFGLPALEAMSCGCPVIASKGGSLPEVLGNAGIYADPYDVGSIAKEIDKAFNSLELRKELSQRGIVQAKKFTWEKTAEETMNVYRNVTDLK